MSDRLEASVFKLPVERIRDGYYSDAYFDNTRELLLDAYRVGSALLRGGHDFTADIVAVDGWPCAKVGRGLWPNPRLQPVE